MKRLKNSLLYFLLILGLLSCDSNKDFDVYKGVENAEWGVYDTIVFNVPVSDTIQPKNVFIRVRNDGFYEYANLFIISKMYLPSGIVLQDTLEYEMADPYGRWLGDGLTDIKESRLFFLENHQFSESGDYTFKFVHAMRKRGDINPIPTLIGITDVGLRIETVEKE